MDNNGKDVCKINPVYPLEQMLKQLVVYVENVDASIWPVVNENKELKKQVQQLQAQVHTLKTLLGQQIARAMEHGLKLTANEVEHMATGNQPDEVAAREMPIQVAGEENGAANNDLTLIKDFEKINISEAA